MNDLSIAEAAVEIIRATRAEEAMQVHGAEHEDDEHPFPGMGFSDFKVGDHKDEGV